MSLGPYTYVTMSIEPGSAPRIGVSFRTGELRANTYVIEDTRPCLVLDGGEAHVWVSTIGAGAVTDHDVTLAREIFNAASRYLADCERLHAQQAKPSASSADSHSSSDKVADAAA